MPILKDYISALVTSMTEARVNADTFSANVARLYLENDMLRHFPVPRMRIGDVEINAPVAINAAESKPVINKPNLSLVSDKVYTVVCLGFDLKVADVDKNTNASKALREGITSEIEGIGNNINESNYSDVLKNGSNKIANSSLSILEKFNFSVDKNKVSEVANIVESTLTKEFVSKKIEDMDVPAIRKLRYVTDYLLKKISEENIILKDVIGKEINTEKAIISKMVLSILRPDIPTILF